MDQSEYLFRCLLCTAVLIGFEEINLHVRNAHPQYWSPPAKWPDGAFVKHISAEDIEPEDFYEQGQGSDNPDSQD